jgi:C_GCAxxG_C_C family probable redox protein
LLKNNVNKYYDKAYNLNCAEVMIYAANDEYKLNLNHDTFKTMSAFGGGMVVGDVCGAITGSLAVLGIMFTKNISHESTKIKELSKKFFNRYHSRLGYRDCMELKSKYHNDELRCSIMIETAADVLDEIITEEKNEGN